MFEELERITLEGRTLSEMSFGNEQGEKVIQGYFMDNFENEQRWKLRD